MRTDREDTTEQVAKLQAAQQDLAEALQALSAEADSAQRAAARAAKARRPMPPTDVTMVHAHVRRVAGLEEAVDLAYFDVRTAAGEDA